MEDDVIYEYRYENGDYFRMNVTANINHLRARNFLLTPKKHIDHPFVGKKFLIKNEFGEKIVTIKSVTKNWYAGYYYTAVYDDENNSSGVAIIKNINSICPFIIEYYEKFMKEFELII